MIYISIGSNLGNRIGNLRQAVDLLKKRYLRNVRCSIVLETTCILPNDAPSSWSKPFLNMVVTGETDLSPEQLLVGLKSIESELGRPKEYERWSPRIIDLDILLWGDLKLETPQLKIPHPELENRPFLLHLLALLGVDFLNNTIFHNCFLKSLVLYPQFVGIVNITNDSFSDGGQFNKPDQAIAQVLKLAAEGASVIEVGAQSTRPGAIIQTPDEEYTYLEPVLEALKPLAQQWNITLSLDTFWPSVIRDALDHYPISWINDVKGDLDDKTLKFIAERDCKVCLMHSLGIPPRADVILPPDQRPMDVIIQWAQKNIDRLLSLGFKPNNIIIDPGIGFGKSIYQSIEILRHLDALKTLNTQILIGHSRKSYIEAFSAEKAAQRDLETIAISATLKHKVDFLRVHNVADHMRFFAAYETFTERYQT